MITEDKQYSSRLRDLSFNDEVLKKNVLSDINQVHYAEGVDAPLSNSFDLSVRYVTGDQYHAAVTGVGPFEPKTLYVVSSDEINAYNTNIKNVKDPIEPQDAANKRYVDEAVQGLTPGGGGGDVSLDGVAMLSAANEFDKVQTFNAGFETHNDISVIDYNYLQTTRRQNGEMSRVYNFSPANSFIQCEEAFPGSNKATGTYGAACTGYRGFCMLWADNSAKTLKLSGALNDNLSNEIMWTATNADCRGWSYIWDNIAVGDKNRISVVSIMSSDESSFTVQCNPEASLPNLTAEVCAIYKWDNGDENGFYFVPPAVEVEQKMLTANGHLSTSIIGNQVIASLYANHAEGGSSKAIGKYAHAEGRRAIAEGRYSHAEGSFTHARDIYSHAEGNTTYANGSAAHTEGYGSEASGEGSHAEGGTYSNKQKGGLASGGASHAEGLKTTASGLAAHAEGISSKSGVRGYKFTNTTGTAATNTITLSVNPIGWSVGDKVTIINNTVAYWNCATIASITKSSNTAYVITFEQNLPFSKIDNKSGSGIFVTSKLDSGNTDLGPYTHAEGNETVATGNAAHAEGTSTYALNNQSHAEGCYTTASGKQSHAEGLSSIASGNQAHAEGYATSATQAYAHAEGYCTHAKGQYSHAAGISAIASSKYSYVWNGISDVLYSSPDAQGSFCVNPLSGIDGFYIGNDNFIQCVLNAAQVSADALRNLLGIADIVDQMQEINNLADEIMN